MSSLGPRRYWKSLDELAENRAFTQRVVDEFPDAADQTIDLPSRRNFFRLMGASMALAGIAGPGCQRYEKEEIVPLSRRPEDQVPGTTLQYASVMELGGWGQPILATSYEGRPIHVDGNGMHPFAGSVDPDTGGAHAGSTPFIAASVLNLYDQDRSKAPLKKGKGATFDELKADLADARKDMAANPGSVRILAEASSSPTLAAQKRALLAQYAGAQWVEWEPLSFDNERAGLKMAFGKALRSIARLDRAQTIVSLDGDLFVEHPAGLRYARDWKASRIVGTEGKGVSTLGKGVINRLWAIESTFTATGAIADHRLPLRSELIQPLVMALNAGLGVGGTPSSAFLNEDKVKKFVDTLVAELKTNKGKAVVVAGRRQPPEVHALVAQLNAAIGAPGQTLDYLDDDDDRPHHRDAITQLVADMNRGIVKHLFILGGNPVYDAPADLDFGSALGKLEHTVHLSEWEDETSEKCTWHVPRAHYLEAWGDARTWDGTWTIAQPLILPLYGGISTLEMTALLAGNEQTGEALVKAAVEATGGAPWRKCVHDGFVPGSALSPVTPQLQSLPVMPLSAGQQGGSRAKNGALEVVYTFSTSTWDGRYANNAWLQETPDFFTKVVWDNYALVAPATAQDLDISSERMITIKLGDKTLDVACYVMPGQAMGSIGLVLGGGRTKAGSKGGTSADQTVGFDTYKLRTSKGLDFAVGAQVTGPGDKYPFSGVQEHWDIHNGIDKPLFGFSNADDGIKERLPEIIREVKLAEFQGGATEWEAEGEDEFWVEPLRWYRDNGTEVPQPPTKEEADKQGLVFSNGSWTDANGKQLEFAPGKDDYALGIEKGWHPKGRGHSLFQEHQFEGHRWAMSIDLGSCIACNACMVACQSENNIPVVGRDQVVRNREMHWIRIDRYFDGSPDDPRVVNQPVGCQQCENAPCEQVCPVAATTHSSEGLNDMAYNRCVGTRYCLNNCPYRVRRFNFLDWNKEFKEARNRVRKLVMNPEVTVRHRGVMEKCTYCVQRIQNAKIKAKNEGRRDPTEMKDGEITTACQDACPTQAIVFGDLADEKSRVSMLHADRRSYELLGHLNTKPRTQYLARVRNPNPDLG